MLSFAAFLLVTLGAAHSLLGEHFLLMRLFRRTDLPRLFGSTVYTARTLRLAWHVTTLAWWGFAALLFHLARGPLSPQELTSTIGLTLGASGALSLAISRGRHLSWPVFLLVAGLALAHAAGN